MTGFGRGLFAGFIIAWASSTALASDQPTQSKTADTAQPLRTPAARSRAIPELVCTSDRLLTIVNNTLETSEASTPLRIRLRGNMLYTGETAGTEKFSSLIARNDRRRWVAATSTLTLDEDLVIGTWTDVKPDVTTVRPLTCEPFDSSKR